MEIIEMRTGFAAIFALAVALFFLHKYTANPLKKLLAKAANNDPEAQYQMGHLYYKKKKEFDHFKQAFMWFETAANNGHVRAMVALAGMYNAGEGCDKDTKRAFEWYQAAAQTGDFEARINEAVCYLQGIGTKQDTQKGFLLLKAAADDKSPLACTMVGDIYRQGDIVPQDEQAAFKYFLAAAKQGEPLAKKRLDEWKDRGKLK